MPAADSFKKRYAFKLMANSVGLIVGLGTQAIVPRGLGVQAYGDFNFLTTFFSQALGFCDPGMSQAFFTKLSQRQNETGLVAFFARYAVLVSVFILAGSGFLVICGLSPVIWPGQRVDYILMAALLSLLLWLLQGLNNMTDAYGITVGAERAKMAQRGLLLLSVAAFFAAGRLGLRNYLLIQTFLSLVLAYGYILWIRSQHPSGGLGWALSRSRQDVYSKEFYDYASPLLTYTVVGFFANTFDRWLLQWYGGSVQQGLFGLSMQVASLCALFTGAMTPLLMREFSVAFGAQDKARLAALYGRYVPTIAALAAFFSAFTLIEASAVVHIFGGRSFQAAGGVVVLMAFFPMYQAYSQLSAALFFAAGDTRRYRDIGLVFLVAGVPLTYFLIAPASRYGLDAGALGLAFKTMLVQVVGINVMLYYNTKALGISFGRCLRQQAECVAIFTLLAYLAHHSAMYSPARHCGVLAVFLVSGVAYTAAIAGLVWLYPRIIGLEKSDLVAASRLLVRFMGGAEESTAAGGSPS